MLKNFEESYEVCNCKNVKIEEIKSLFNNNEINSLRDLQEKTFAGTECRHCLMEEGDFGKIKKKIYCMDILKELKNG